MERSQARVLWFRSLAGEHAALTVLIERVEKLIAGGLAPPDARFLASILDEIVEHCRHHMALEERDGYLPIVRQRLPNADSVVEALVGEHPVLLAELAGIVVALERAAVAGAPLEDALERLKRWIAAMRQHEACENRLVQEAYTLDYGGGD